MDRSTRIFYIIILIFQVSLQRRSVQPPFFHPPWVTLSTHFFRSSRQAKGMTFLATSWFLSLVLSFKVKSKPCRFIKAFRMSLKHDILLSYTLRLLGVEISQESCSSYPRNNALFLLQVTTAGNL